MLKKYFTSQWKIPEHVVAGVTTRKQGLSLGVFSTNNLALHVGDNPEEVLLNRKQLANELKLPAEKFYYLEQVHGIDVIEAPFDGVVTADAVFTSQKNTVCCIMTADCLPILLCNKVGSEVAAIHAGWRSLAAGIIEATIERMQSEGKQLTAFLGPAISQKNFEVGAEVKEAFIQSHQEAELAFKSSESSGKYMADLYLLAKQRLEQAGVDGVSMMDTCTFADEVNWYSYRRDSETGRMLSFIYIKD